MNYWDGDKVPILDDVVMVFGSNPQGRHGMGAALDARRNYGAIYGQGRGLQGNSYGLVTKNLKKNFYEKSTGITYTRYGNRSVSLEMIRSNIDELYDCARNHPELKFYVIYKLQSHNGLNGYKSSDILKQFYRESIPDNIYFHKSSKILFELMESSK